MDDIESNQSERSDKKSVDLPVIQPSWFRMLLCHSSFQTTLKRQEKANFLAFRNKFGGDFFTDLHSSELFPLYSLIFNETLETDVISDKWKEAGFQVSF